MDKERNEIEIKDAPKKHDAEVVIKNLETLKPESHLDPIGHYKMFNKEKSFDNDAMIKQSKETHRIKMMMM